MYRLIIIEDEDEIRYGLCELFPWEKLGFVVTENFSNGKDALYYLKNNEPDVILSDISLPFHTGLEIAAYAKEYLSSIVVLISGYKEFEYARQAIEYNVKKYILKPTNYNSLLQVFSEIKNELDSKTPPIIPPDSLSYDEKVILKAKEYIQDNLSNITLSKTASYIGFSNVYFSRFFKEKTGENFSYYVQSLKMEQAAQLLQDIALNSSEIAQMLGYSNVSNFSRIFKHYYGVSPIEYRKRKLS